MDAFCGQWIGNGKWITNVNYNKIRGKGRMQDRADMCLQDIKKLL